MATSTVTLDKAYFETLLRRAQFHTSGVDYTTPLHVPTVTIPKPDHDSLLDSARQYGMRGLVAQSFALERIGSIDVLVTDDHTANLRRNLYRGGIAEETLAVLIQDDAPANGNGLPTKFSTTDDDTSETGGFLTQQQPISSSLGGSRQDYTYGRNANYTPRDLRPRDVNAFQNNSNFNEDFAFMPDGPSDGFYDGGSGNNDSQTKFTRQQYEKFAKRTVLLANLPEGATHADIVDVVRGGMLLDIYVRSHDKTASVSFLEESAAQDFFRHVKRHDLYIRGKRVEIRWNDRQFILPGHVANKIAIGATRNLVIHNRSPKHTEDLIRDDLEHIHNLIVIRITFSDQDAYISTNSVHNAMFARTCMMSRATYKGSKIEWDDDECAAPLQKPQKFQRENTAPKKKSNAPLMNRFQLLNMDGEDGSEVDEDHDTSGLTFPSTLSASTTLGVVA